MGFTDDVKAHIPGPGITCAVGLWRQTQDATTLAEFDTAMADSTLTAKAIWLAMCKRGFTKTVNPVNRHRGGDCQCPSPATSTTHKTT